MRVHIECFYGSNGDSANGVGYDPELPEVGDPKYHDMAEDLRAFAFKKRAGVTWNGGFRDVAVLKIHPLTHQEAMAQVQRVGEILQEFSEEWVKKNADPFQDIRDLVRKTDAGGLCYPASNREQGNYKRLLARIDELEETLRGEGYEGY